MELHLSPELEAVVRRGVEAGGYESAEAYVAEAVELFERQQYFGETRDEFERKLDDSLAEADRGELSSEEEVRAEMRAMKAEWIKHRSAA